MKCNKLWAALKVFAGVTATLVVILMLAPSAGAQTKYKTLYRFTGGTDGSNPYAGLIFDTRGNLYSTTVSGGAYGYGVVFELTPKPDESWTENVLYSFTGGKDGANPDAGLIFDTAGILYGTTVQGGNLSYCSGQGCGVVFNLTPKADGRWKETVLHHFTGGKDGANPRADVIFDPAGNLYGTTEAGGWAGSGEVFKLTPNTDGSWTEKTLHGFLQNDGGVPSSRLVFDQIGNLYGTTVQGGNLSDCSGQVCGAVFKLFWNPIGWWTCKALHYFTGKNGAAANPRAGLIFDQAGNLYGTTEVGGRYGLGEVFKLTPNPEGRWGKQALHDFTGGKDGANPLAGLIFDQAGNLYGTTRSGADGYGVVFKLTLGTDGKWRSHALHAFRDTPGAYPHAGLIFDAAGNLYGTTYGDGSTTFGSVFEITP